VLVLDPQLEGLHGFHLTTVFPYMSVDKPERLERSTPG
jgi:hypothetical protein